LVAAGLAVALVSAGAWGFVGRGRSDDTVASRPGSRIVRPARQVASADVPLPLAIARPPSVPEAPRVEVVPGTVASSERMPERRATPRLTAAPRRGEPGAAARSGRARALPPAASTAASRSSSARRDEVSDLLDPY